MFPPESEIKTPKGIFWLMMLLTLILDLSLQNKNYKKHVLHLRWLAYHLCYLVIKRFEYLLVFILKKMISILLWFVTKAKWLWRESEKTNARGIIAWCNMSEASWTFWRWPDIRTCLELKCMELICNIPLPKCWYHAVLQSKVASQQDCYLSYRSL